jgi:hypothetical protein
MSAAIFSVGFVQQVLGRLPAPLAPSIRFMNRPILSLESILRRWIGFEFEIFAHLGLAGGRGPAQTVNCSSTPRSGDAVATPFGGQVGGALVGRPRQTKIFRIASLE